MKLHLRSHSLVWWALCIVLKPVSVSRRFLVAIKKNLLGCNLACIHLHNMFVTRVVILFPLGLLVGSYKVDFFFHFLLVCY